MNQKLSDWASVAEIVSGLAVVITLVFLLMGIQANTSTTRVSVYSSLVDSVNYLESQRLNDPELLGYWRAFRAGEAAELEENERRRLGLYLQMLYRVYEKAYVSNKNDVIGASEWERFRRSACGLNGQARNPGWILNDNIGAVSDDFAEFLATNCEG